MSKTRNEYKKFRKCKRKKKYISFDIANIDGQPYQCSYCNLYHVLHKHPVMNK